MSDFWTAFWPNLAATFVALVLGIPTSLFLNRIALYVGQTAKQKEEEERLRQALSTLVEALEFNVRKLDDMREVYAKGSFYWEVALDTSAWEAVRSDVAPFLHDPVMKRRLAYHFSRMSHLASLNENLVSLKTGAGAALSGPAGTRQNLLIYSPYAVRPW